MGTTFFTDSMMPAAQPYQGRMRQVEIFRPSGKEYLALRIGELDEEHQGRGFSVELRESEARELLEGLVRARRYFGYKTDGLI